MAIFFIILPKLPYLEESEIMPDHEEILFLLHVVKQLWVVVLASE